jgi:hypothetical protein
MRAPKPPSRRYGGQPIVYIINLLRKTLHSGKLAISSHIQEALSNKNINSHAASYLL